MGNLRTGSASPDHALGLNRLILCVPLNLMTVTQARKNEEKIVPSQKAKKVYDGYALYTLRLLCLGDVNVEVWILVCSHIHTKHYCESYVTCYVYLDFPKLLSII